MSEHPERHRDRRAELLLGATMVVAGCLLGSGVHAWRPWLGLLWPAAAAACFPAAAWSVRQDRRRPPATGRLVVLTLVISIAVTFLFGLITGLTADGMFLITVFFSRSVLAAPLVAWGLALCTRPLWARRAAAPLSPVEPGPSTVQEVLPAFGAVTLGSGVLALIAASVMAEGAVRRLPSTTALVIPFGVMYGLVAAAAGWAAGAVAAAVWRRRAPVETPVDQARPLLLRIYGGFVAVCAAFGAGAALLFE